METHLHAQKAKTTRDQPKTYRLAHNEPFCRTPALCMRAVAHFFSIRLTSPVQVVSPALC